MEILKVTFIIFTDTPKNCIAVVGCFGRIITISIDVNVSNEGQSFHPEFLKSNAPNLSFKEHQISGPIKGCSFKNNYLVHCTIGYANKVWVSYFARSQPGVTIRSFLLPLVNVAGLHLLKTGRYIMWYIMQL